MNKLYTELNITRVCVMLGDACDFHCRHCIMKNVHTGVKKRVSEELIKYLQKICDFHPNLAQSRKDLVKISFWGGEPLLYFPVIKEVVERVDRPNAEYSIVTNGKNLTNEHVDFFNGLKRGVVFLSNDGPETDKIRDENMLESHEFCDLFNSINNRGIDSIIHAYNQDYYRLWDYIDEKCGNIPIAHEFLEVNWDMPSDLYDVDLDRYRASCEKAAENFKKQLFAGNINARELMLFNSPILRIRRTLFQEEKGETPDLYPACGPYHHSAHIDLQGNMYVCHNGMGKLGHVSLGYQTIAENCSQVINLCDKRRIKNCEQCSALVLCRKGCPFVLGDIKGNEDICEMRRIFYATAIKLVAAFGQNYTEVDL